MNNDYINKVKKNQEKVKIMVHLYYHIASPLHFFFLLFG
jgi:hypothetical protein